MYVWLFLVPMAAKSLSLVESPAHLNAFGHEFALDLSLPFSWTAFYFAALSFVVGNLAFAKACPAIVQDNDSYATFRADAKDDRHLRMYNEELGVELEINEWGGAFGMGKLQGTAQKPHDTPLQQAFWTLFEAANSHNVAGLRVSGVSYAIGLFLIFWVAMENLGAVIKLAW